MGWTPRRTSGPLLLSVVALAGTALGFPVAGALLLYCPGWGLTRSVSVLDRVFGLAGSSLCLSMLVLGGVVLAGRGAGWSAERTGLVVHVVTLALCLVGRWRWLSFLRWRAGQPPHPDPMPLVPRRTTACLVLAAGALLGTLRVAPLHEARPGSASLREAAVAAAWLAGAPDPADAARDLSAGDFPGAVVAGLCAATGLAPLPALRLLCLASLLACLLLVAESVSRLLGNRGAARAMLAFLLGLNPLAVIFVLLGDPDHSIQRRMAPEIDPALTTALAPFVGGLRLPMTLALTALLLFTTLSVVRRSSTHMPRLMALAGAGLVLADMRAALLLLPGWWLGLLMSHLACRGALDNDLHGGRAVRRAREPLQLRAPFWRPTLHLALGAGAALALVPWPALAAGLRREPAWALIAALGPACVLYVPGVRHLNASPGREAFFFVGLCAVGALLAVGLPFAGDHGELATRLFALVLAVPAAHGALKLLEPRRQVRRASVLLATGLVGLGPVLWLVAEAQRERPVLVQADGRLVDTRRSDGLLELLRGIPELASPRAALLVGGLEPLPERPLVALAASRALLPAMGDAAVDASELLAGQGSALLALRGRPGLAAREMLAVTQGPAPPGFHTLRETGALRLSLARPPDVVLVSVSRLRADRVTKAQMPGLSLRARTGLSFHAAITPTPGTQEALARLLGIRADGAGREPGTAPRTPDQGGKGLASTLASQGYRTAAIVAMTPDPVLLTGFEEQTLRPGATAPSLIDLALATLGAPDRRPLFLWLHLEDLTPPYVLAPGQQSDATGAFPFPSKGDLESLAFGVAAFPPAPSPAGGSPELDVARGTACYDALIAGLDQALAPLLGAIPAEDLLVVTAPHGTSLDEHEAYFVAGPDLYEPSIRVPLVVAGAGIAPGVSTALFSLSDLGAFLATGRPPAREAVLLESLPRPGLGTGALLDAERDPGARGRAPRIWGLRTAEAKTILTRPAAEGAPATGVRFDLLRDPDEREALAADAFDLRRIDAWRRRTPGPAGDS